MRSNRYRAAVAVSAAICIVSCHRPSPGTNQFTPDTAVVREFSDAAHTGLGKKFSEEIVEKLRDRGQPAMLVPREMPFPEGSRYTITGEVLEAEAGLSAHFAAHAVMRDEKVNTLLQDLVERRYSKNPFQGSGENRVEACVEEIAGVFAQAFLKSKFAPQQSNAAKPHMRKILITEETPPANTFVFVKNLEVGKSFYGTLNQARDELAVQARDLGADAVIEAQAWFRVTGMAWVAPTAGGKAIIMNDPCAPFWAASKGGYYPRESDTENNRPLTQRCLTLSAPQRASDQGIEGKPSTTVSPAGCTTEQILSMKSSGLSDAQVRRACEK